MVSALDENFKWPELKGMAFSDESIKAAAPVIEQYRRYYLSLLSNLDGAIANIDEGVNSWILAYFSYSGYGESVESLDAYHRVFVIKLTYQLIAGGLQPSQVMVLIGELLSNSQDLEILIEYINTKSRVAFNSIVEALSSKLSSDGLGEIENIRPMINSAIYRVLHEITLTSIAQYDKNTQIASEKAQDPSEYLALLLQAEEGIRCPSLINKEGSVLSVDRNGFRIRVYTGDNLTQPERAAISAYRLCQYANPAIDHDKTGASDEKIPFFDTEIIFEHRLRYEDPSQFTGSSKEYHVVVLDRDGKIDGYVCLENPLSLADDTVTFGSPNRGGDDLYGLEKVFGADVLTKLAPELGTVPINQAVDIVRLIPRASNSVPNREKIIIAYELALALASLVDRFIAEGRTMAICDTELAKIGQIFSILLGINPVHGESQAQLNTLDSPYDKLLAPRYTAPGRQVSCVAFELHTLLEPQLVARRQQVALILQKYAEAKGDIAAQRSVIAELNMFSFANGVIDTKLGRGVVADKASLEIKSRLSLEA